MWRNRLFLMIGVMAISLSACSGSGQTENSATAETTVQNDSSVQTEADSSSGEDKGQLLIDTDEFRVEYRGIDTGYGHNMWAIKLYIENHSDSEVRADIKNILVNDCFIRNTSSDNIRIPAGESMEDNSNLINIEEVQYYQVESLDSLRFDLDLVKPENGNSVCSAKAEYTEDLSIPAGEVKPSKYNTVLYDSDNILIKTAGICRAGMSGFKQLDVYMENNGEETVGITFPNMKINGKDVEYSNAFIFMPPHSKSASVPLNDYLLKEEVLSSLGIESIETVSFDIEANYETVKRSVSIDGQGNILESGEEDNKQDAAEEVPDAAENAADDQNTSAQDNVTADETAEAAGPSDSGVEGIIIDENAWKDWKSDGGTSVNIFVGASSEAGVKWDLMPNPEKLHKNCYLIEDGEVVQDIAMYYATEDSKIFYVG